MGLRDRLEEIFGPHLGKNWREYAAPLFDKALAAVCAEEGHNWRLLTELNNPGMDYCNRCKLEVKASKWKRTSSSHLIERRDLD